MSKKGLLVGALTIASILPLASCQEDRYEITEAGTFLEAYDLFKNFFAKTFEHTNMSVNIVFCRYTEGISYDKEEILDDVCHRSYDDESRHEWAFVDDKDDRVFATSKTITNDKGEEVKEGFYRVGNEEYLKAYKSYIRHIDIFADIAKESALTGKTPEEVGGFSHMERAWTSKNQKAFKSEFLGKNTIDEYYCRLTDENDKNLYTIKAATTDESGLVNWVEVDYPSIDENSIDPIERSNGVLMFFSYDKVKEIKVPSLSGLVRK